MPGAGWDATAAAATPRPTVARPTARSVARSRPAAPSAAQACGTATADHSRRARTFPRTASRPPHRRPARRASPTPNQRRRNYYPSVLSSRSGITSQRPDEEVPLRVLIDRPSTGATSCCRLRHLAPPGGAGSQRGLRPGKRSWLSPDGGRGNKRMTYKVRRILAVDATVAACSPSVPIPLAVRGPPGDPSRRHAPSR